MNKIILSLVAIISLGIYAADNEIYVEQSGATANLDLEQLGSANIIGRNRNDIRHQSNW